MGKVTSIQWCHHTFSPWEGCAKVSPGCANCYAEARADRFKTAEWGVNGTRRVKAESGWNEPLKWDRDAAKAGERRRVFCASLADVFEDRPDLVEPRIRLFNLVRRTPHLDWMFLTKRPQNARPILSAIADTVEGARRTAWSLLPLPNLWFGVSVENQAAADERIPVLLSIPAPVRFLSMEPLLGPVDLTRAGFDGKFVTNPLTGVTPYRPDEPSKSRLGWVIVGGESGPKARPFDVEWARSLRDQCAAAGVAYFCKQLGARPVESVHRPADPEWPGPVVIRGDGSVVPGLRDSHGGEPQEWPEDLRVRETPAA